MDSPPRVRFDEQDAVENQSAEEAIEASPDMESEGYELELDFMTGKGISRLCSELLELKKASDEDFQRNVYSNYSAFLRIFEEIGGIKNEIMKMENHVSTQKMLLQKLMNSFHPEMVLEKLENMKDECVEDLDLDFPNWLETRMKNILETLDILISEHRMEETLVVLEKENQALQKLRKEKDFLLPIITSFASAISHCRTRLVEQFASLAGHKRVTWPELYNALFGLIRLSESDRASTLLLNFFHLQLQNSVNDLKSYAPFPHGTYILELVKVVFFTIIQASRSYVVLFGETSPYTSDIMQWARAELEVIYHSFDMYVKSISETRLALDLAVETMNLSFSFCSLLQHERLSLQPDIIKLMKPCITEVLHMHFDQLRKVVSLLANTDNWVLGKFLVSGKSSNKSSSQNINENVEYRQVTTSGRKFITLMQMVLDDAFLFHSFHLESLILKGLTDLFDEYVHTLRNALTIRDVEECDFSVTISTLSLQQQISILVNSSELGHLLPTLVQNSLNSNVFASDMVFSEQDMLSSTELELWKLAIQEISDQLKNCFLLQFVSGIMTNGNSEFMKDLDTCSCGQCILGSSEDLMPSFLFQELFMWLRHLEEQFELILLVEDGMMNSLLNEIMGIVIFQLSENWDLLKNTKNHRQLLLDMHFLVEIARDGDYFSDNLLVAALDLMRKMELELSKEFHLNSETTEEGWASNAAKLAIKTLLEAEGADSGFKSNPMMEFFSKSTNDNHEVTHERMDGSDPDVEFVNSLEDSTSLKIRIKKSQPLQISIAGPIDFNYDNEGSKSPIVSNSCIEDKQAAAGTDTISDILSETISVNELDADDFIKNSVEDFGRDCPVLGAAVSLREIKGLTRIIESETNRAESNSAESNSAESNSAKSNSAESYNEESNSAESNMAESNRAESNRAESNSVGIQLIGVLKKLELDENFEHKDESVDISISADSDGKSFAQVIGSSEAHTGEAIPALQTEDLWYDSCNVEDEMFRFKAQHYKEEVAAKENDQNDRYEAEDELSTGELQHFEGKLLASDKRDVSLEEISGDEFRSVDHISLARDKKRYSFKTNGGQDRPNRAGASDRFKHSRVTERFKQGHITNVIEKNKMGRTTRPQWQ